MRRFIAVFVVLFCCVLAADQAKVSTYQLKASPEKLYLHRGDVALFKVKATCGGVPVKSGSIHYALSLDLGRKLGSGTVDLVKGTAEIRGVALQEPGFLRCDATLLIDGKNCGTVAASAAVDPYQIEPGQPRPKDFEEYWKQAKASMAAIPMDVRRERIPKFCNDSFESYRVSFANHGGKRIYGFLNIPKGKGPFPAIMFVPGAGRPLYAPGILRYEGFISVVMNVHHVEAVADSRETARRYDEAFKACGGDYGIWKASQRDTYYMRDVYLGLNRALDYVRSLPEYDGKNLGLFGSSQGGGSALILSAMNPDVTYAIANVPALCDHGGFLKGRQPGWPQVVKRSTEGTEEQRLQATAYVDAANFAPMIHTPTLVIVGGVDPCCSPSSVFAAYNRIPAKDKKIILKPDMRHEWSGEFDSAIWKMLDYLKGKR